ncbi:hypothetical protein ACH5RR_036974 [Cinchona calisaya]|uniref:Uncharacterized protein n=1 Tax=Cinchona calisaya TaxID=153742 RepID=A0ABD2Y9N4_9GENT
MPTAVSKLSRASSCGAARRHDLLTSSQEVATPPFFLTAASIKDHPWLKRQTAALPSPASVLAANVGLHPSTSPWQLRGHDLLQIFYITTPLNSLAPLPLLMIPLPDTCGPAIIKNTAPTVGTTALNIAIAALTINTATRHHATGLLRLFEGAPQLRQFIDSYTEWISQFA